jgi:hypothetical protein
LSPHFETSPGGSFEEVRNLFIRNKISFTSKDQYNLHAPSEFLSKIIIRSKGDRGLDVRNLRQPMRKEEI